MENITWSTESRLDKMIQFPVVINGVVGTSVTKHSLAGRTYYCGYIILNKDHPYYGRHYDECVDFDVPGGFTYSSSDRNTEWWLGFDTYNYNASKWTRKDVAAALLKLVDEFQQIK